MKKMLTKQTVFIFVTLYLILGLLQGVIFKYANHVEQQQRVDQALEMVSVREGKLTADSEELLRQQFPKEAIYIDDQQLQDISNKKGNRREITGTIGLHEVTVVFPLHEENELMYTQFGAFTVVVGILFLLALWSYKKVIRHAIQPLEELTKQVRTLSVDNIEKEIRVPNAPPEVASLEQSMQRMQKRLHDSFEQQEVAKRKLEQFVSDASHELKTPLTSIQGFTEVLLRSDLSNASQVQQSIEQIHLQTQRMVKLTSHLLQLAHLDREEPLQLEAITLQDLIEDLQPVIETLTQHHTVEYVHQQPMLLQLDVAKMQGVLLNFIQNAVRYSAPNTRITIRTAGNVLEVLDEGDGIAEAHIPYIFDRFYRTDEHRARATGGEGLGLAITKEIVVQHGGHIDVQSVLGEGSCFRVTLPIPKK